MGFVAHVVNASVHNFIFGKPRHIFSARVRNFFFLSNVRQIRLLVFDKWRPSVCEKEICKLIRVAPGWHKRASTFLAPMSGGDLDARCVSNFLLVAAQ